MLLAKEQLYHREKVPPWFRDSSKHLQFLLHSISYFANYLLILVSTFFFKGGIMSNLDSKLLEGEKESKSL